MTSVVALIPARGGSRRLPGKNTRKLADHPLLAYTVVSALNARIFDKVLVCSDTTGTLQLAAAYGAEPYKRLPSLDDEADIEWVKPLVTEVCDPPYDAFAILRPTSPFRTAETIRWAWQMFTMAGEFDSIRGVTRASQHPGKMWTLRSDGHLRSLEPLLLQPLGTPWHSSPTQSLPPVYVQTAGIEIAWTDTVRRTGTIAGNRILALDLDWPESLDINDEHDWWLCEEAIRRGQAVLPLIPDITDKHAAVAR